MKIKKILLLILLCLNINLYAKDIDIILINALKGNINVKLKKQINENGDIYEIVQFKSINGMFLAKMGCYSGLIKYTSKVIYDDYEEVVVSSNFFSTLDGQSTPTEEKKLFLGHDLNSKNKIRLTMYCADE